LLTAYLGEGGINPSAAFQNRQTKLHKDIHKDISFVFHEVLTKYKKPTKWLRVTEQEL
jgi:hypothetical protein